MCKSAFTIGIQRVAWPNPQSSGATRIIGMLNLALILIKIIVLYIYYKSKVLFLCYHYEKKVKHICSFGVSTFDNHVILQGFL